MRDSKQSGGWIHRAFGPQRWTLHIGLFLLTCFTTVISGVGWSGHRDLYNIANLQYGLTYAWLILFFISAHEFGHFIAARIHGVSATLPYYIPYPGTILGSINFGTFGAVIRLRDTAPNDRVMFDIGVAGPIAGFVACLIILGVGFATLPDISYLRAIHPMYPIVPAGTLEMRFGTPLIYSLMQHWIVSAGTFVPPMTEMYHYPYLCAGWFGLFVTALNLLPIGQLDGGHLTYTLFGSRVHRLLGKGIVALLLIISVPELVEQLAELGLFAVPTWLDWFVIRGGSMWFIWALLGAFVIKFHHPASREELPLDLRRKIIGYATIGIFILCFMPTPIVFS